MVPHIIEPRKRIPMAELRLMPEFQRLTQKQQLFVSTYCEGGLVDGNYDAVAATRTAYQCKSAEVARIMSYSLLQNIRIVEVLNRHFNTEPIEEFLVLLDRAINNKHISRAQVDALKLKSDILGFGSRIPGTGHTASGVIPQDVLDASREARKPKKKSSSKPSKPPEPSEYENEANRF